MSDGPDHLRSFLERMASEAAPGEALPGAVRRRVRRRQAGTALVAVLLMTGLAIGGVVGVRSLGGTRQQRTIQSPVPSSRPPPTRTVRPSPSQAAPGCRSRWIIQPNPKVPGDYLDLLVAADALSSNNAWAVGRRFVTDSVANPTFALIEHWDGIKWTIVPGADQGGRSASLAAIAAIGSNDVWAVGQYEGTNSPASRGDPLVEHWDGRAWSIVPVPAIGQDQDPNVPRGLIAVAAVSANDIWALGYYGDNTSGPATVNRDVFMHWDGTAWKLVASPRFQQTKGVSAMQDLAAVSSNDVWAVGGTLDGFGEQSGAGSALVEHWNGKGWSLAMPSPGGAPLSRVAAIARDDVWAVQGGRIAEIGGSILIGRVGVVHWNGQAWSTSLSLPKADGTVVTDITAVGHDNVWVVGMQGGRPLIRHWDGRKWTNPNGADSSAIGKSPYIWLTSVSRMAGHAVIAFGSEQDPAASPQNRLWLSCAR